MYLFEKTVEVLKPFLGFAAQKYLKDHLEKMQIKPENLKKGDLPGLIKSLIGSAKQHLDDVKLKELRKKLLELL